MADVVFILGAGCSVDAGAPTSNILLDRARDLLSAGRLAANPIFAKSPSRENEFKQLFKAISNLQRVHSKAKLDLRNVESVFSAVDIARTLGKLPGFDTQQEIEEVSSAMRWVIVKTLEHCVEFSIFQKRLGNYGLATPVGYDKFGALIGELNKQAFHSTAIITFNYDLCLEVMLENLGIRYDYGLGQASTDLPLLKLHGSLNWFKNEQQINTWSPTEAFQKSRKPSSMALGSKYFLAMSDLITDQNAPAVTDILPVIIPPLINKGDEQRQLTKVWQRAAKELSDASHIFVLGYSLPITDQFFRLLFALGTEGANPLRSLRVFDIDEKLEERYRSMLGEGAASIYKFANLAFRSQGWVDNAKASLASSVPR